MEDFRAVPANEFPPIPVTDRYRAPARSYFEEQTYSSWGIPAELPGVHELPAPVELHLVDRLLKPQPPSYCDEGWDRS